MHSRRSRPRPVALALAVLLGYSEEVKKVDGFRDDWIVLCASRTTPLFVYQFGDALDGSIVPTFVPPGLDPFVRSFVVDPAAFDTEDE